MSKKNVNNETNETAVGVNTPERIDEMNENNFYDEDTAQAIDEGTARDSSDSAESTSGENADQNEAGEEPKGFLAFVKKHWKVLVAVGAVTIIGGVVFIYFMGKTYKVDASKLADVIPFPAKDNGNVIEEKTTEELMELAKQAVDKAEEKTA